MKKAPAFLLALLVAFTRLNAQEPDPDVQSTLVVFNRRDPLSEDLAKYYAEKRHIPGDHVISVDCTIEEQISREEYEEQIAGPLKKTLLERGWWKLRRISDTEMNLEENQIRFVALIRGVPLKILPAAANKGEPPAGAGDYAGKNEASVDSELACLGYFPHSIGGALSNPYYRKFIGIRDAALPALMLVCRLDAPTGDIVRRMIDDSIETEQTGLWGFAYIDSRNIKDGGLAEGDKWLLNIVDDATKHGIPVIHDNGPALFPDNYPMRYAAFYYGWYANDVCGPFAQSDFRFVKGAVACHIHSFSASTLREPDKAWAGPLLMHGASAVLGNVFEPFLTLTANLDLFHERLESGFTFAESAYMSLKVVSWMNTNIGDPLYKPFKIVDDNPKGLPKPFSEWAAFKSGARVWIKQGPAAGAKTLIASAHELHSGIILESLGLLQANEKNFPGALASFQQARVYYTDPEDIIRAAIHESSILGAMNRSKDARILAGKIRKVFPSSPSASLLQAGDDASADSTHKTQ